MELFRRLFLFMKLYGSLFRRIIRDIEYLGDNGLHIVKYAEDFLHGCGRGVILRIMLDVIQPLNLVTVDAGNVGEHQRGELGHDLRFFRVEDAQIDERGMHGVCQLMVLNDSIFGAKADGVRVQREAAKIVGF